MKIFDSSKIIVPFRVKKISKYAVLALLCSVLCTPAYATIGMQELGDSLTAFTGFSRVWSPPVRVKQLRADGRSVTVRTNATLHDVRWTPQNLAALKQQVSRWVLGHPNGKVTIYTGKTDIDELVTDLAKGSIPAGEQKDLTERNIALWPSHGLYYNADREEWIWQRATLWTTVEDLYSQEYVKLIRRMLENAGATVHMPRAGLENQETGASGLPRWAEGARYWLKDKGVDPAIWDLYEGNEYKDDMKCRPLWVNEHSTPMDLCLAFHTDGQDSGDDSTIIGTLVIYTAKDDDGNRVLRDGRNREKVNRNFADYIQTQVTQDLQTLAPEWTRRQLKEANYCESRVPVVPSIILELLSHKNMADMRYGLDPKFRFAASRAVYKGILRYLNGKSAVVQPLPVEQLAIDAKGLLRWEPKEDALEPEAKPSYYMVYIQQNEGEWDVQQVNKGCQLQTTLEPGTRYNYYVVAGNDGGLSFPSPMVSAFINAEGNKRAAINGAASKQAPLALIIDAFNDTYGVEWFADSAYAGIVPGSYACEDGFSCAYIGAQWNYLRANEWIDDDNCGWGSCYRDHAGQMTVGNTRNWSALHGKALQALKISYVSATEGLARVDTTYALVDVVCGRQRQPLMDQTRSQLASYLRQGGKVLLSSDHLSAVDPAWLRANLHASYYARQATHSGRVGVPGHRVYQLFTEPNEEQLFTCTPEGLSPAGMGAKRTAQYLDMRCGAAVGYTNASGTPTTLVYGFPLEAVRNFESLYKHSIEWLLAK